MKTCGLARANHVRYPLVWPGHVKPHGSNMGTTMLDTPWVAWTRENTWFQLGATMLDTPPGWLGHMKTRGWARDRHVRYSCEPSGKSQAEETVSSYYTSGADSWTFSCSCAPPTFGNPGDHMLDTLRCGLDTCKHVAPARDHHVRYTRRCPGHVKSRGSSSRTPC